MKVYTITVVSDNARKDCKIKRNNTYVTELNYNLCITSYVNVNTGFARSFNSFLLNHDPLSQNIMSSAPGRGEVKE